MENTPIPEVDSSVNPVMGCDGCELWNAHLRACYAGLMHQRRSTHTGFATRFDSPVLFPGRMQRAARWRLLQGLVRPEKPWLNQRPRLVFISDMGDALSANVTFADLKTEIIDAVSSGPGTRHQWLWMTRRPHRLAEFAHWLNARTGVAWPSNLWVATSATDPASLAARGPHVTRVGSDRTVRLIVIEPLWTWKQGALAPLIADPGMNWWVMVGGESKQSAAHVVHECQLEWMEMIRDECQAVGVPLFVDRLGHRATRGGRPIADRPGRSGPDWNDPCWPAALAIREMPDSRLWC